MGDDQDQYFHQVTARYIPTGDTASWKTDEPNLKKALNEGRKKAMELFDTEDPRHVRISIKEL